MNILLSCIGRRDYIPGYFRPHLRQGERIIGTSHTPWTPAFGACDVGLVLPPIASGEYVPAVLDACRTHDIGGLLSFFDPDVVVLSRHLDEIDASGVVPMIPGERAATIGYDKWRTFLELREARIRVPSTMLTLEEARARLASSEIRFPLIVKPRSGFGSANVFVAATDLQLHAFFSYGSDMLIQEFVEGETYNVEVLSDPQQRVLHAVAWRRLLSRAGETLEAVTVEAPDLIEIGTRVARTVGLVGPMDIDLIVEPSGEIHVIELNLRFGGGYPVSHLAGADFPGLIVEVFRGEHPAPRTGQYERDVCLLKGLRVMGGPAAPFLRDLSSGSLWRRATP